MALIKRRKIKLSRSRNQGIGKLILTDDAPWPVQEAYKALRTNLSFSLPGADCKVVCVTSGFPGDGKSSNVINTAISFGQLGKKVLLLDCDMRMPTCSSKLGVNGIPGLADLLTNQAGLSDICHKNVLGIDFISAGTIPPDPTWLLQSEQMSLFLSEMRKFYDWVFIDMPPITTVTDAAIISRHIDGYLLVVRHQSTEHGAVADMLAQLEMANAKILGFIYNDYTQTQNGYYKKYYKR